MIRVYCDKCGECDERQHGFFEITVKAGEEIACIADYMDDYTGNLCPECFKKFKEFMGDAD